MTNKKVMPLMGRVVSTRPRARPRRSWVPAGIDLGAVETTPPISLWLRPKVASGQLSAYGASPQMFCRCAALWSAPAESRISGMATALWLAKDGGVRSPWRFRSKAVSPLRSATALHKHCRSGCSRIRKTCVSREFKFAIGAR